MSAHFDQSWRAMTLKEMGVRTWVLRSHPVPTTLETSPAPPPTARAEPEREVARHPPFALLCGWVPAKILLAAELESPGATPVHRHFLADIARALGGTRAGHAGGGEEQGRGKEEGEEEEKRAEKGPEKEEKADSLEYAEFSWPMGAGDHSKEAAQLALSAYLKAKLEKTGARALVVLGRVPAKLLGDAPEAPELPLALLEKPAVLMASGEAKKAAWLALQKLLAALGEGGTPP